MSKYICHLSPVEDMSITVIVEASGELAARMACEAMLSEMGMRTEFLARNIIAVRMPQEVCDVLFPPKGN